ncbi:unnamed protein product [Fraxinus pennsylvanica]|uniref:DUF4408 domain-containing protein n=1 Tax=Fraxinus pennsylvanica TaxID=56036 RepID=A0AAD1YL86_9LAMI|nr:unnamed protein product [Fraxinus pennsylvanica]
MKSGVFSNAKFEKAKTIARFNSYRKIAKPFRFLQVSVVCALVFWSLTYIPTAVRISGEWLLKLCAYLFNYHVVFLNAIILLIFVLCRQNEVSRNHSAAGDLVHDFVKHSEVHPRLSSVSIFVSENELIPPEMVVEEEGGGGDEDIEEKRILCTDYDPNSVANCDEITMAIEKATKEIKRFQRIQSPQKPQRSKTENLRMTPLVGAEIERLSNEEFQRTVQTFICRHHKLFLEQKLAESNLN